MPSCLEDPKEVVARPHCLHAVSKNLEGTLKHQHAEVGVCDEFDCRSLNASAAFSVKTPSYRCDSKFGSLLETLEVPDLFTSFEHGNATDGRGVHAAKFRWTGSAFSVEGDLSGTINANTARKPVEPKGLVACFVRGLIEGQLCGKVVDDSTGRLREATLIGNYRLRARLDPNKGLIGLLGVGTFEGVLIQWCKG